MSKQTYLTQLDTFAQSALQPLATQIDQDGLYPRQFMQNYGAQGGFAAHGDTAYSGLGYGVDTQIESTALLGRHCGSTAFNAWCQTTCAWYIQNSRNVALRDTYLANVLTGKILAGTGLSNTMKSLAGIERHSLSATPHQAGFIVNGSLRAVTNIGEDHIWAATAEVDGGGLVMFIIEGNQAGVSLNESLRFCALNGTQTLGVTCEKVYIPSEQVLATPENFDSYLSSIKSGFVLLQLGMALGALYAAADIMAASNQYIAPLNQLLDYGYSDVQTDIEYIQGTVKTLVSDIHNPNQFRAVLALRLFASETVLKAVQSAALHAGALGYSETHHAQRLSREAMFVAIITPSIKHLKQEIRRLDQLENRA